MTPPNEIARLTRDNDRLAAENKELRCLLDEREGLIARLTTGRSGYRTWANANRLADRLYNDLDDKGDLIMAYRQWRGDQP